MRTTSLHCKYKQWCSVVLLRPQNCVQSEENRNVPSCVAEANASRRLSTFVVKMFYFFICRPLFFLIIDFESK